MRDSPRISLLGSRASSAAEAVRRASSVLTCCGNRHTRPGPRVNATAHRSHLPLASSGARLALAVAGHTSASALQRRCAPPALPAPSLPVESAPAPTLARAHCSTSLVGCCAPQRAAAAACSPLDQQCGA